MNAATRTLTEISDDLHAIVDLLCEQDGELTDDELGQTLTAWLESLEGERDSKLDGYAWLIKEIEARALFRKSEAKRLGELAGIDERKVDRLKERLQLFFRAHSLKTVQTSRFRLTHQGNGGLKPLLIDVDAAQLPGRFQKATITVDGETLGVIWELLSERAPGSIQKMIVEADVDAIRQALNAGEELGFARLSERGTHMRIA